MARFAVYESVKTQLGDRPMPFYEKIILAAGSGAIGGVCGQPADLVNVRMQNDMKLEAAKRRNYKHAIDGMVRIVREEGTLKLFNGVTMTVGRAIFITIGQLSCYDQIKEMLMKHFNAPDNVQTHLFSSFLAASAATVGFTLTVTGEGNLFQVLTQPLDVMKTRMMNAKPGEFKSILDCFLYTAKTGPSGFYKGKSLYLHSIIDSLRLRSGICSTCSAHYPYARVFRAIPNTFWLHSRGKTLITGYKLNKTSMLHSP
jgi:dicarboxylate transporter 10